MPPYWNWQLAERVVACARAYSGQCHRDDAVSRSPTGKETMPQSTCAEWARLSTRSGDALMYSACTAAHLGLARCAFLRHISPCECGRFGILPLLSFVGKELCGSLPVLERVLPRCIMSLPSRLHLAENPDPVDRSEVIHTIFFSCRTYRLPIARGKWNGDLCVKLAGKCLSGAEWSSLETNRRELPVAMRRLAASASLPTTSSISMRLSCCIVRVAELL